VVNWIETIFFINSAADVHLIWENFCTIIVFSTEDRVATVVDQLFPYQKVAIVVKKGLFRGAAELILLALELVRSKD